METSNLIESTKGFTVTNLTPKMAELKLKNPSIKFDGYDGQNHIVLDFGRKTQDDLLSCTLKFEGQFKIDSVSASCGCTRPSYIVEDGSYIVNVSYDSSKVREDVSTVVSLYDGSEPLKINIVVNKPK